MVTNLDQFSDLLMELKPIEGDISQQSFDVIATYIEKEELDLAAEMILKEISDGNLDIRLITYYLYSHFAREGVACLTEMLPLLQHLIVDHWESLKPKNRKERQVENSLNWLFSNLLTKFKHMEKMMKDGKSHPVLEKKLTSDTFDKLQEASNAFRLFFLDHWKQAASKEKISHLVKKIEEMGSLLLVREEKEPPTVPAAIVPTPIYQPKEPELLQSVEMQKLIKKLKTFELLIAKKELFKAAMVSQDISNIIKTFNPCLYFPQVFAQYLSLLARHASPLSAEWQNQDSLKWKSLEKLYETDIDEFVDW